MPKSNSLNQSSPIRPDLPAEARVWQEMETYEARLNRLISAGPHEIPLTLLNSIKQFGVPELEAASNAKLEGLVILGIHAVIQTVGEYIFGLSGPEATKFYLEHFLDGPEEHERFSDIHKLIHDLRNARAHRWMSSCGHDYAIDYREEKGWWRGQHGIHINPSVYFRLFKSHFPDTAPERSYARHVSDQDLRVRRCHFVADWLQLDRKHAVRHKIEELIKAQSQQFPMIEEEVLAMLAQAGSGSLR